MKIAELETLFTADIADFEKGAARVEKLQSSLAGTDTEVQIRADDQQATAAVGNVESELKQLDGSVAEARADVDATGAVTEVDKATQHGKQFDGESFEALADIDPAKAKAGADDALKAGKQVEGEVFEGTADIDPAKAKAGADTALKAGKSVEGEIFEAKADVDASPISSKVADGVNKAIDVAGKGGEGIASAITDQITDGLGALSSKTGPLVGSAIGLVSFFVAIAPQLKIGEAITSAILSDTKNVMKGQLQAATGLDEATAKKWGRAVGESYAQNFGASIEDNMAAARSALESGLLGGDATSREITDVTNRLQTVAGILGEDVPAVSRAAGTAVKNGLAKDSVEALDLITKAQQNGVNVADDLLDTFNEYSSMFRVVGLSGQESMGLLQQGLKAGARDADYLADAIKEFGIRGQDASQASAEGFRMLGLDARKMTEDVAAGGDRARGALDQVLDALRNTEDPVTRNAAAVSLFGTKAEDLGDALFALDLDSAAKEFGDLAGTVDGAMSSLANNSPAKIERAKRGIESAVTGIQDALAEAFSPHIQDFAEWVSSHRGDITQFLLEVGRVALEGGKGLLQLASAGLDTAAIVVTGAQGMANAMFGFVDGVLSAMEGLAGWIPGLGDEIAQARDEIAGGQDQMNELFDTTRTGALNASDMIDQKALPALDDMIGRFEEVGGSAIQLAHLGDAEADTTRKLEKLAETAKDGAKVFSRLTGEVDLSTEAGRSFDRQATGVAESLEAQLQQARRAGEGQKDLNARYDATRSTLVRQMTQMGLTGAQAKKLADQYLKTPKKVVTDMKANTAAAKAGAKGVELAVRAIPNSKHVNVTANTKTAQRDIDAFVRRASNAVINVATRIVQAAKADGGIVQAAAGRIIDRAPMIAQGGANILWAEPETGWEAYISGKPGMEARNRAILREAARRLGEPLAAPAPAPTSTISGTNTTNVTNVFNYNVASVRRVSPADDIRRALTAATGKGWGA